MGFKKKGAAALATLLIFAGALAGCSASPAAPQPQTLRSGDGKHTITVPGDWQDEGERLNPRAILGAGQSEREQYVIVLADSRDSLAVLYPDFTLEQYTLYIAQTMSQRMGEPQLGAPEPVEVGERPGVAIRFSGELKGAQVSYWLTCLELEGEYIQLIAWTPTHRAEESAQAIGVVLASYAFDGAATASSSPSSGPAFQKL